MNIHREKAAEYLLTLGQDTSKPDSTRLRALISILKYGGDYSPDSAEEGPPEDAVGFSMEAEFEEENSNEYDPEEF